LAGYVLFVGRLPQVASSLAATLHSACTVVLDLRMAAKGSLIAPAGGADAVIVKNLKDVYEKIEKERESHYIMPTNKG
jgi:hypothetical protein